MSTLAQAVDWPAPPGVKAFVSVRGGGVSGGGYASLNLAAHVGDRAEHVAENRRRLRSALELPAEPQWLEQTHGAGVVDLDRDPCRRADAAVTGRPGVVCAVLTADCLPVVFAARGGGRVGVAHAGWRGLAAGILPNTVRAMGVAPGDLLAWLGPAISAAAYEVGGELRARFVAADPAAAAAFRPNPRGRWQADLYRLARLRLAAAGVGEIYGGGACTFGDASRYFSHRREAPCGRMATLIWLD